MKNINPIVLPNFLGIILEYLGTFLLEFEVAYRTYDYTMNAKKVKLFP